MARLGHASIPVDLMTYAASDAHSLSIFLLKEDKRQSILTVFNWTEGELKRSLRFADLGLKDPQKYRITDVFGDKNCCTSDWRCNQFRSAATLGAMFKLVESRAFKLFRPHSRSRRTQRLRRARRLPSMAQASTARSPYSIVIGNSAMGLRGRIECSPRLH